MPAGKICSPEHCLLAYRIDRMYSHGKQAVPAPRKRLLILPHALLFLPLRLVRVISVKEDIRLNGPQPHLRCSTESRRRMPIMVIECSRPCPEHLKTCRPGAPVYKVRIYLGLDRPYPVKPAVEKHILLHAAHKGHCRMGMHVHKSRHSHLSGTIHLPCPLQRDIISFCRAARTVSLHSGKASSSLSAPFFNDFRNDTASHDNIGMDSVRQHYILKNHSLHIRIKYYLPLCRTGPLPLRREIFQR